jgi:2-polyprenyl-3-methyl-5-hydroxy-6-metoxy-1,4-benzoquinol methylase
MDTARAATNLSTHQAEVQRGERFEFGKNWKAFLAGLNDDRIVAAETSLKRMLEVERLDGRTFIDIGSGSGLFSLAAQRLGARVHSFDYDPHSVACTTELRRRYFPTSDRWTVEEGSALDPAYLARLGQFDVVYSWGVLHHTGQMWQALENVTPLVAPGGKLFIAIYNDLGSSTARWRTAKRMYNAVPRFLQAPFAAAIIVPLELKAFVHALVRGTLDQYFKHQAQPGNPRGMSRWRDTLDWVGGYPYEVATPDQIFNFYRARGFELTQLIAGGVGVGCNEFVFERRRP